MIVNLSKDTCESILFTLHMTVEEYINANMYYLIPFCLVIL